MFNIKKSKFWLSPMESVSDLGFRTLCYDHGADLTFIEMIHAAALVRKNKAAQSLVDAYDLRIPTGIQLFVTKSDVLKECLLQIKQGIENKDDTFSNLSVIDLNFGCPSPEIIKIGGGPALLKRTAKMVELLIVLKKYSPLPCGIKIRLGMNRLEKENKVYLNIIKIVNDVNLDYITVHPKLANETSSAPIDMDALQEIIDHAKIPVVGNGFITNAESAKKMFNMGCSAVMIARAAIGNPWIFEDIKNELDKGKKPVQRTRSDYLTAWTTYKEIAEKYGTKEKHYLYHKKAFEQKIEGLDSSYPKK